MIWGCPALIDQRVQHSELFEDSTITSVSDFLQQVPGSWHPFCGFVMIIVQSWRVTVPAGFEWTMTLAAGREHYLFGGHDSLYARCSGLSRQSLWLAQIGPPPVCKSMSMSNVDFAAFLLCLYCIFRIRVGYVKYVERVLNPCQCLELVSWTVFCFQLLFRFRCCK